MDTDELDPETEPAVMLEEHDVDDDRDEEGEGPVSATAESCVVTKGEQYRTPFDPCGLVEVISVGSADSYFGHTPVCVRYVEDHPHGYEKGEVGFYCADNLRFPE